MKKPRTRIATRIAFYYLIFGGLWILLSDHLLAFFFDDPVRLTAFQTYKGWLFVTASAALVYGLLKYYLAIQHRLDEERRENEERFRLLFNSSLDAVLLGEPDGSLLAANPAACKIFGRSEAEICALGRKGLVDPDDQRVTSALQERANTGIFIGEITFVRKDGSKFPAEISSTLFTDSKGRQQAGIIIRDITERKEAEARILLLNRLYATLSQINQTIVHIQDKDNLFKEICRVCVEYGKFTLAWIGLIDADDNTVNPVTFFGQEQGYLDSIRIQYRDKALGYGPTGTAIREGRCVICKDVATDPRMAAWRELALKRGFKSSAAVPIREGKQVIGAFTVYAAESHIFRPEDESLLTEIGDDISFALDMMRAEADRNRSETARLESEERLRLALYAAQQGIYDLNVQTGETVVNDIYAAMLGYDPHTFLETNKKWLERLHPDDVEPVGQVYRDYTAGKLPEYRVEFRQKTASGDWKWLLSIGKIVEYDPEGRPLRMLGTHTDINESKKTALRIEQLLIENARLIESLKQANEELFLAYDATIEGWSRAMDLRDHETEGHTQRVTEMTVALARKMNIAEAEIIHLRRGALLHDIGKMGIPDAVLLKPGLLTDEERKIIQRHPQYAFDMLQSIGYLRPALDIPRYHHEKWDGTGYPYGLKADQIPLVARLFAIIDVYDALTTDRPYRKAWSETEVIFYISEQRGRHFDPNLAAIFLEFLREDHRSLQRASPA